MGAENPLYPNKIGFKTVDGRGEEGEFKFQNRETIANKINFKTVDGRAEEGK